MTKRIFKLGLLAISLSAYSGMSIAETVVARYLEFGATATDNPDLLENGGDSELVLTVKPSVELQFTGNRFGSVIVGEVEHFQYTDSKRDVTDPRLFARVRGTLIDNLLYLDTTATYSKLSPDSNFLRPADNSDPALNLKARLFVYREFGQLAELYVGLNHASFFEQADEAATSQDNGIDFSLGRNPKYGGFLWGVGGYYSEDESDTNSFKNSSLYGSIGTTISKTLYAEVSAGTEFREFVTGTDTVNPTTVEDENSSLWEAGLTWSPSESTSLYAGFGERFFGRGPSLQFRHRALSSDFKVTYARDVTRSGPSLNTISPLSNNTDTSLVDPETVTIDSSNLSSELDEPFVDNRLQLSYKLNGRRSDVIADVVYSVQDQISGDETIKTWLGRLVFDRKLSDLTLLRLQYDHQQSDAPQRANRNYTENRFAVKFILNFDKIDSSRDDEFVE